MDSRDFGLEITSAIGGIDYLHYGYWDPKRKPQIGELFKAQEKYTDVLLKLLDKRAAGISKKRGKAIKNPRTNIRILDIGCGSGKILSQLLEKGYQADGLVPSDCLYKASCDNVNKVAQSKNKVAAKHAKNCKVYKCYFECFCDKSPKHKYDILLFSESFQYIKYKILYANLHKIMNADGEVVIADFFAISKKKVPGNFGGGHLLEKFYAETQQAGIKIISDKDITKNIAPNVDLLDDILMNRLLPASQILDEFIKTRINFLYSLLKFFLRKKLKKIEFKYFTGQRTAKQFSKYKSYRMLVLGNK